MTSPIPTDLVQRVGRQLANCSDSYEAPSGKIMFRIWANDLHALHRLAREAIELRAQADRDLDALHRGYPGYD